MTISKSLVAMALLFSLYAAQAQEFPRSETLAVVLHPETYHKRWAAANDPAAAALLSTLGAKVRDTDHGVLLIRLSRKSAAVRAGLRKGDVITAVDGRPIANILALAGELLNRESGSKVKLSVVRAAALLRNALPALETGPHAEFPNNGHGWTADGLQSGLRRETYSCGTGGRPRS